jgi:serine/threonine protein phosphatase 1
VSVLISPDKLFLQAVQPRFPEHENKIDGNLVYAVGDIHGCYKQLKALLKKIADDAAARADGRNVIMVFCGDYVDRGPDSALVLDSLCWLRRHSPYDLYFLKGNHEEVLNAYLRDPRQAQEWLQFGGRETLLSYGVTPPEPDAPIAHHFRARADLLEAMPVSHWRFLESLELMVTIGDFAFVHAGVRGAQPLAKQTADDLLWIRAEFLDYEEPHEKIIVHGHSWNSAVPDINRHRIGIDTGTYETGVLTALRIEDSGVGVLQASA